MKTLEQFPEYQELKERTRTRRTPSEVTVDKGVFVTTDKFTGPALDYVRSVKVASSS